MTMRYAHLSPEHLRSAAVVLDNVLPTAPADQAQGGRMRFARQRAAAAPAPEVLDIAR